jgi:anti-sigma B factor antagonist
LSDADRPPADEQLRDALRPRGPVRFAVSEHEQPGATVVRVDGELDALTAPQLAARLASVTRRHRGDVVVDLRRTVFIDSVGLHVLLSAHRRLARASRSLSVGCDEGPVRRVFERARLLETLGIS